MSDPPPDSDRPFRWQALLQRAGEAVFVLDRRGRLLFVNRAWEELTGVAGADARGLVCRRPAPVSAEAPAEDALAHLLTPPPDVKQGLPARARRRSFRAGGWWDVDFLPIRQAAAADVPAGYLLVGRIVAVPESPGVGPELSLPERLVDLRERRLRRYGFELLNSLQPAVARLAQQARLAATLAAPVMLVGEPGAGKHTLARILHARGPGRDRAFTCLDCRVLPATLVAESLEGGAPSAGLLYLASPEALPRELQQLLCERFGVAGGGAPRLAVGIASDPLAALRAGRLLDRLYWQFSVVRLDVPPLRDRPADLPRLVEAALAECAGPAGPPVQGLTAAAWEAVRAYPWPGNLRELRQALGESAARAATEWIDAADLPAKLRLSLLGGAGPLHRGSPGRPRPLDLERVMGKVEARLIERALRQAEGNRTRAADLLGINRPRLLRRMETLGLGGDPEG